PSLPRKGPYCHAPDRSRSGGPVYAALRQPPSAALVSTSVWAAGAGADGHPSGLALAPAPLAARRLAVLRGDTDRRRDIASVLVRTNEPNPRTLTPSRTPSCRSSGPHQAQAPLPLVQAADRPGGGGVEGGAEGRRREGGQGGGPRKGRAGGVASG